MQNQTRSTHGTAYMRMFRISTSSILTMTLLAGSAVGSAAQEEAADLSTPACVTWEVTGDPTSFIEGTFDEEAGELRGQVVQGALVEASDPRLSGRWYYVINGNIEEGANGFGTLESRSWRMVNHGGAWTGTSTFVMADVGSGYGAPAMVAETFILIGEGADEGPVAVSDSDYGEGKQGDAVILELSVPPVPDLPEVPAASSE